jgi:hypothetical protein
MLSQGIAANCARANSNHAGFEDQKSAECAPFMCDTRFKKNRRQDALFSEAHGYDDIYDDNRVFRRTNLPFVEKQASRKHF